MVKHNEQRDLLDAMDKDQLRVNAAVDWQIGTWLTGHPRESMLDELNQDSILWFKKWLNISG